MVFDEYANYYDLLYRDKDYIGEAKYIGDLLHKYGENSIDLLELGCGTGRHAILLSEQGYKVHGVDISPAMLQEAKDRSLENDTVSFSVADIRDFSLGKIFDAAISLFHVMSYQNLDKDFLSVLRNVHNHLKNGGVFIFDCWYGPAVLFERPELRVKRLENSQIKVTRLAEPFLKVNENIVEVHYDVFVENKKDHIIKEFREIHSMRYFFCQEIRRMVEICGFSLVDSFEFMSGRCLNTTTWGSCFVLKKQLQ